MDTRIFSLILGVLSVILFWIGSVSFNPSDEKTLSKVEESCKNSNNLLPPIIEAVKAGATMGEIVITMKNEFGEWNETSVF